MISIPISQGDQKGCRWFNWFYAVTLGWLAKGCTESYCSNECENVLWRFINDHTIWNQGDMKHGLS